MNLRDLGYLVALSESRHFGKAAEACHVSQPTLSAQIRKLEEELGVALFERTNKSVRITPLGEQVLGHARLALEQAEAIRALARASRDPLSGPLKLGVIPTLGPYILPLILTELARLAPRLSLVMSEETTDRLLARLSAHEIDAALLATEVEAPELEALPLFDEPFWLAYPRGNALGEKERIDEADLRRAKLLLLADGHCLRDQALALCQAPQGDSGTGAGPDGGAGDLRAASLETILNLVGAGYGSTLVPALAIRGGWTADMGIQIRPLDLPNAGRRVVLVSRRSFPRRAALAALASVIRDHLPNTVKPVKPAALGAAREKGEDQPA